VLSSWATRTINRLLYTLHPVGRERKGKLLPDYGYPMEENNICRGAPSLGFHRNKHRLLWPTSRTKACTTTNDIPYLQVARNSRHSRLTRYTIRNPESVYPDTAHSIVYTSVIPIFSSSLEEASGEPLVRQLSLVLTSRFSTKRFLSSSNPADESSKCSEREQP
jgi:hypothetical protein